MRKMPEGFERRPGVLRDILVALALALPFLLAWRQTSPLAAGLAGAFYLLFAAVVPLRHIAQLQGGAYAQLWPLYRKRWIIIGGLAGFFCLFLPIFGAEGADQARTVLFGLLLEGALAVFFLRVRQLLRTNMPDTNR